jgi:hypothetical protein
MTTRVERITVGLTDAERNLRAREIPELLAQVAEIEFARKEAAKESAAQVKELEARIEALGRAVRTGVEDQDLTVSERPNRDVFTVSIVREDTGEVVRERPMTDDELRAARQASLPLRDVSAPDTAPLRTTKGVSPLRGTTRNPTGEKASG